MIKKKNSRYEKIKAYFYLFQLDKALFFQFFIKYPFAIFYNLFFTKEKIINTKNYTLFNVDTTGKFEKLVTDLNYELIFAFSYCQKPNSCIKERFSNHCSTHCNKCLINSFLNLKNSRIFTVTTTIDLGRKLFNILNDSNKNNKIFVFTACPYAVSLYRLVAKIFKIKAIALNLEGPVCNNFQSFEHAEKGGKQKQTYLSASNKAILKNILQLRGK